MKKFYFFVLVLVTHFSFSQQFTDTKGELQISGSGTAVYTLPIATPPSIKNVAPVISLVYSSGVRGGIAGQGWSINSISTISRMATRRDIDGFVDGVDFDDNDKLALDGQRLLLKTGTYWANGSVYETEYKSNTRIELKIEGTTTYFIVTAPDGSRSWYGSKGSGILQNSASINSWYIVRFEDTSANFIDYNYKTVTYNSSNQLYIDTIVFSGNATAGVASQNKISFVYKDAKRIERDYIKGVAVYAVKILDKIEVYAGNSIFRAYKLSHLEDKDLGYERVEKITEINGQSEESNPVVFSYAPVSTKTVRTEKGYTNELAFDETQLAGDFDGDGRLDFIANNQIYTNLFNGTAGNSPVDLPFKINKRQMFSATTLLNNKINQFQSVIIAVEGLDTIEFKVYNLVLGSMGLKQTKIVSFDNSIARKPSLDKYFDNSYNYNPYYPEVTYPEFKSSNVYLEGDFNGDGISEVLIESTVNEVCYSYSYGGTIDYGYDDEGKKYSYHATEASYDVFTSSDPKKEFSLLNLDANASSALGSKGYVKFQDNLLLQGDKKYIADFNSDGKSDILLINDNKTYRIISFKQLLAAPWIELEIIASGTIDVYSPTKQILFGDFNGDGKIDIMLPDTEGGGGDEHIKWHIYYNTANSSGGQFFTKESHNIVEYCPDTQKSDNYKTQLQLSNYYAMDINGDGKSDLVRVWRKYYKAKWTINNHDTAWQVTAFTNNVGKVGGSGFTQAYDSGVWTSDSPDIPIPITSNYKYNGANTDLVLVRGHNKKIEYYQFNKNVDAENRLVSVAESSGNIKHTIEYKSMEALDGGLGNATTDFYSSGNSVTYPNIEILKNSSSYLVSKLTATINGVSKYQSFRYRGFVSNFNYGTVGFTKVTRSSWCLQGYSASLWTTQYNDPALRGANTITWTSKDGNTVFDALPTDLISTKTNEFEVYSKGGDLALNAYQNDLTISERITTSQNFIVNNSITALSAVNDNLAVKYQAPQIVLKPGFSVKATNGSSFIASPGAGAGSAPAANSSVYNVLLTKQTAVDHLSDTKTETAFTYDGTVQSTNYYGLETKSITKRFSGTNVQGTTTVDTEYDNNPTGAGTAYYVGRPKKVSTSTTIYTGDTRTSNEIYTYTGTNLTKTEKKGHNTYAIIEDMTYDILGNLLTKTVSAPGALNPPVPRKVTDEYDSTKRFVIKKIDHQKFETTFVYNTLGQVKESKDYLGVVSSYIYDNWGKLKNTSIQNTAETTLTTSIDYAKLADGGYTTTITNNTDAKTITQYDVLGRVVKSSAKGFTAGSMVSKEIVYDGLGRKAKESEPYFTTPNQWTTYTYDYLMRPKTIIEPSGKTQIFSYEGLTTKFGGNGKVTEVTVDALGNKTQTKDPGGIVKFTYYANGQLKESNYDGNSVKITIDGWGNKIAMTDPSAGTYLYTYDAFGQLETEATPNGATAYKYDDGGKVKEKTIKDTNTNTKTTYTYNTNNLIVESLFKNMDDGTSITNSFVYDKYSRISKTVEKTPYAVFTKELFYDTYGRALAETSTAAVSSSGKSSFNKIKHTYQNGFAWQLIDDSTQKVLWQTNSLNERGQLIGAGLGNGITVTNNYDQFGFASQFKWDRAGTNPGNVMTLTTVFEPKKGNLTSRTNNLFNWNESFSYDVQDQLLTYNNEQGKEETQRYDTKGRIAENSVGTYGYPSSGKTYQNSEVTLTPQALSYYKDRGTGANTAVKLGLDITYNTFKSPVTIKEQGRDGNYIDYLSFTYNDGNDRSTMFYGGSQENKLDRPLRKHYSGDGTMEIKENRTTGATEFVTYIGGDGYSAPLVLKTDDTTQNYLYLHRDYQGTILAITDNAGAIVEKRLFDAWGAILKVQNGAGVALAGLMVLDRGYTGHEHLQSIGIINMNGRLYDPKLHRFLQPDNFIQDPSNTQNYNRYGYVLNNPLKYTDPSGEFFIETAIVIGAVIGALTYTITALLADVPFSVGGLLKATFIGAASSAVTFGIGSAAGNLFSNFYLQASFQAAAHGTFQGGMTAISGGKFWSGFAAGALSSIAASAWSGGDSTSNYHGAGRFASSGVGMISFGTVSGGVGAQLTGGNFWQGAVTGLVVSALNHYVHQMNLLEKEVIDFDKLIASYPGDENSQISSTDAFTQVGGAVKDFYDTFVANNSGKVPNACALRASIAFNDSGYELNYKKGLTYKGEKGKNYYLSSEQMAANLPKQFILYGFTTKNTSLSSFNGQKGIYYMQPKLPSVFMATGHISIWNGSAVLGGHSYADHSQFYQATLFK